MTQFGPIPASQLSSDGEAKANTREILKDGVVALRGIRKMSQ